MTKDQKNVYIEVQDLTKSIHNITILENLTFQVQKGEILGLLGPNGAGKSTILKILVGITKPTNGIVKIYKKDVLVENEEVKKFIGYLPEHNPLYLDMYVSEFLFFIAKLRITKPASISDRIDTIVRQCALEKVYNKKISILSKGYRQRIGLAQSLIHDPPILLLDEPTTGLDPSQILEIRNLIKSISHNKAVIMSTHIMQEVEMLCTDILILNSGKIVLNTNLNPVRNKTYSKIYVEFKEEIPSTEIKKLKEIEKIEKQTEKKFILYAKDSESTLQESIFTFAKKNNYTILEMKKENKTIEDLFLHSIAQKPFSSFTIE